MLAGEQATKEGAATKEGPAEEGTAVPLPTSVGMYTYIHIHTYVLTYLLTVCVWAGEWPTEEGAPAQLGR